jgi:Putative prokaryotic signal transducing protein
MKKLFSSDNSAELASLQNVLGAVGIPCVIREDSAAINPSAIQRELSVGRDADYLKAKGFYNRSRHASPDGTSVWKCGTCGAGNEDRFNSCWKCGRRHDAAA